MRTWWWPFARRDDSLLQVDEVIDSKAIDPASNEANAPDTNNDREALALTSVFLILAMFLGIPSIMFTPDSAKFYVFNVVVHLTTFFLISIAKIGWNVHSFIYLVFVVMQLLLVIPNALPIVGGKVLAAIIILLQSIMLLKVLRAGLSLAMKKNPFFNLSITIACAIYMLISIGFLCKGIQLYAHAASLYSIMGSCLAFAFASMLGSKVTRRCSNNDLDESGQGKGKQQRTDLYSDPVPGLGLNCLSAVFVMIFAAAFLIPPIAMLYSRLVGAGDDEVSVASELSFYEFGWSIFLLGPTLFLHAALVSPYQIHVRSDASILIKTLGNEYVYDNATHAILNSADSDSLVPQEKLISWSSSKDRDGNVVFGRDVFVYLAGDEWILQVAPTNLEAFIEAVNRAGRHHKRGGTKPLLESKQSEPDSNNGAGGWGFWGAR